mgnify:CR=1 FL=1
MSEAIEFKDSISTKEFCRLRQSVGFQKLTDEQAKRVLENTSIIINVVHKSKSIGIVRILTDMVTDAYITDVIIDPDFQGIGLGKKMLDKALEDLKEHSVSNVKLACSLYANQGKELFYEKFGFQKLPNGKYGYGMLAEL